MHATVQLDFMASDTVSTWRLPYIEVNKEEGSRAKSVSTTSVPPNDEPGEDKHMARVFPLACVPVSNEAFKIHRCV